MGDVASCCVARDERELEPVDGGLRASVGVEGCNKSSPYASLALKTNLDSGSGGGYFDCAETLEELEQITKADTLGAIVRKEERCHNSGKSTRNWLQTQMRQIKRRPEPQEGARDEDSSRECENSNKNPKHSSLQSWWGQQAKPRPDPQGCVLNGEMADAAARVTDAARKVFEDRVRRAKRGYKTGCDGGSEFDLACDLCVGPIPQCGELLEEGCLEFEECNRKAVALRMLRASMGNEQQAVKMIVQAAEMRIRDRALLRSKQCEIVSDVRIIGLDLQDHPAIFMSAKTQTAPLKEMRDQLVLTLEAACQMTTDEGTIVLVVDMLGISAGRNCDFSTLKELSDTLGTVYADRIHSILVVDFSRAAQAIWWLIKPMMSERTQKKFAFVSGAEARSMVGQRFDNATSNRICGCFDLSRDRSNSVDDLMLHAQRTAVGEVPFGALDTISCSAHSESTCCDSIGSSGTSNSDASWDESI